MRLAEEETLIRDDSGLLLEDGEVRVPRSHQWWSKLTNTLILAAAFFALVCFHYFISKDNHYPLNLKEDSDKTSPIILKFDYSRCLLDVQWIDTDYRNAKQMTMQAKLTTVMHCM